MKQLILILVALTPLSEIHAQATASNRRLGVRDEVTFTLHHPIASPDTQAVFVLGDLPELGRNNRARAVKLVTEDGDDWHVTVSLPADRTFRYRFGTRFTIPAQLSNPANFWDVSPLLTGHTRRTAKGPGSKRLRTYTTLREPVLHWRQDGGPFVPKPLRDLGPGRMGGERHCGLRSFGLGERSVEFYLTSGDGTERDPASAGQSYRTSLDACFLQDGALFSYVPAPAVSPLSFVSPAPMTINSAILGQERAYHVVLPRGYEEHTERRYPVLYLYDGQMLWSPHPVYAQDFGTWDPDGQHMASLVRRGLVGEVILVAIEFIELGDPCDNIRRGHDCVSPEDVITVAGCGIIEGHADLFLSFIVNELKPSIDATYRTRTDREHTFAAGASLGGVFAMYAGWEFPDTFGAIASQSGSFWIPRFTQRIMTERGPDGLRIYLDNGTSEVPNITLANATLRDSFAGRAPEFVVEGNLRYYVGFGQAHNYTDIGSRLGHLMSFLWPATSEENRVSWPSRLR